MGRKNKIIRFLVFLIFALLFLVSLSFFKTGRVDAEGEYKVKSYLIVPSNWRARITAEKEAEYKRNILNSLAEAQNFYRGKLSGHTFEYVGDVETINTPNPYADEDSNNIFGDLFRMNLKEFPVSINTVPGNNIYIIYFIGSRDKTSGASCSVPCYETPNKESNLVLISHDILDSLGSDASILYTTKRNFAKGLVTHELGHTFGLVYSGWAITHPCSIISKDDCKTEAVIGGKYPNESESSRDIMGTGYQFFPDSTLNNTIYNPEVQKIFQSLFINPNKDPAPSPLESKPTVLSGKVDSFGPNPISPGDTLTITGRGLGSHEPGFFLGGWRAVGNVSGGNLDISVISWRDNEVKLIVKSSFEYPTKWIIYLLKTDEEKIELPEPLTVQGTKISISPIPVPTFAPQEISIPTPIPTALPTADNKIIGQIPCQKLFTGGVCVSGSQCPAGYGSTGAFCSVSQVCCASLTSPIPTPTLTTALPSGKIPYSDSWDLGCRNLGGTKCWINSAFQSLCTENGGISLGQGQAGGCYDQGTTCCKYVTSCGSLNGQCVTAFDKTNVQFQNEPTHTRVFGYCPTDLYDYIKNGEEFQTCWNRPGVNAQNPSASLQPSIPTLTPTPISTPVNQVNNNSSASPQPKIAKKIVKMVVGNKEYTSNFDQAFNINLSEIESQNNVYIIAVTISYNYGNPKYLFFTFNYKPQIVATPTPTPSPIDTQEAICNAEGGACLNSCSTDLPSQVGTCPNNQVCCITAVTTPASGTSKCTGTGPAASGWGGSCKVGDPDKPVLTSGGTACSIAACYLKSDINEYCWYNSGTPYADYQGCYRNGQGVIISTPLPIVQPTENSTTTPAVTSCDTSSRSGPGWQWNYICGCVSVDNGISEPGHYATCSVNPQQDTHCYSNVSNPVAECPVQ